MANALNVVCNEDTKVMKGAFAEPEQFIRDLERVSARPAPSLTIDSFTYDLDRVHRNIAINREPAHSRVEDLAELARRFNVVKAHMIDKLGGPRWRDKLPANDPLRCSIGLLGTLDLGLRETAHTRELAWLMNPSPSEDHGFGDALLRTFLKKIFNMDADSRLSDVRVESEFLTGESRDRLDICMSGKWILSDKTVETWLVIVEAKINADEGEDQCAKYEDQCRDKIDASNKHALVFITPDGREPTTGFKDKWKRLTFITLMALFRPRLPDLFEKPGFPKLRQYMTTVLKDLYHLDCGGSGEKDDLFRVSEYLSLENTGVK